MTPARRWSSRLPLDEKIRGRFDEWVYTLKKSVVKGDFTAAGLREATGLTAEEVRRL